ncbi:hypothetical protein MVES1_002082 [Malassezia vespertilionis]|uniref:Uncharacterized protein n=1 Tax=Malassezia vespertilionis TaxID=2020962 RepID=A0A2N1JC23_9BASI|nr:uncharacterized protein MVES1_002082 [Malassezia vespertilionis]PKI84110.1 hypothetical protein MVES_001967 [Malassezia vespertilionis]WFD06728.1 hypothetical protein MVES1_002082 [Malassezia vespertilionis]
MTDKQMTFENPEMMRVLQSQTQNLKAKYEQNLENFKRNTGHDNPLAKQPVATNEPNDADTAEKKAQEEIKNFTHD